MKRIYDGNFWECVIPEAKRGDLYKFRIYQQDGRAVDHCDPFAQYSELRPGTASVLWDLEPWEEETPFRCHGGAGDPVNIYELHAGSWKKPEEGFFTYRELADQLVPYLAERGYNFLELLPLCEHPCDPVLGVSGHRLFQPHLSLWNAPGPAGLNPSLPPGGNRRAAGLCPRPFRRQRLRPVAL